MTTLRIDPTLPKADEKEAYEMPKRARGKPRRAPGVARKVTVRIDDVTAAELRQAFGSLGNALFHTFRGIQLLKARAEARRLDPPHLPVPPSPERPIGPPPPTDADWLLLTGAVHAVADAAHRDLSLDAHGHPHRTPTESHEYADALERALRRLELYLGRPERGTAY